MKRNEVDRSKLSPMMKQYMEIKDNYEDSIVFFRLGDFYEMFFEDGLLASRELEIALTGKSCGLAERAPMCGVPHHSATAYIDRLIEKGYKVAICEQLEDAKASKGVVKRGVIRVVTKGTVVDAQSLDANANNFIAAVSKVSDRYVVAYTDLSTGEMYAMLIDDNIGLLYQELLKLDIKEVVLDLREKQDIKEKFVLNNDFLVSYTDMNDVSEYQRIFAHIDDVRYHKSIAVVYKYLEETQKRNLDHLQDVKIVNIMQHLRFDHQSKRNLELTETIRTNDRVGSLLWFLDKTKTAMGARMLKSWIESPIIDVKELEDRYDLIDKLQSQFFVRDELKKLLDDVYDLERLATRIAFGSANARDLIWLKKSFATLPSIKHIADALEYKIELSNFEGLFELIDQAIVDEPPIAIKNGGLIKSGYDLKLDEIKTASTDGKQWIASLEASERERTGIKNLKIGYNKVFGYYIEVTKGQMHLVKDEFGYDRKQTLTNAERFITPELKEKEALILGADEKLMALEYQIFTNVREEIKKSISAIQIAAKEVAKLDVIQSFSYICEENNFVRPILSDDRHLEIIDGRHPVVEKIMDIDYVENDIVMNKEDYVLLITGPNMAGKSTYMRQLAITVILTQIGCFVPARKAIMPVFDQIFTRIGATDDLTQGQSTFMVEMIEANFAIQYATEHSLILFDELGRGTATFDGMSLAHAIIEYVHDNKRSKTLFSTHYHELTSLEEHLPGLKNVHASADEKDGEVVFLHKIKEGPTDKSYGIHVAKLAHLPNEVIKRADNLLRGYENRGVVYKEVKVEVEHNSEVISMLEDIDVMSLNPVEALSKLYEIKQKLK
jgi:DNA mismatch repair protein MutS